MPFLSRALTILSALVWLVVQEAWASHPDDATCPDTHTAGPESLDFEVTVRDTGQVVPDGMVLPAGTRIRFQLVATAYGSCQTYHYDPQAHACVAGTYDERTVAKITSSVTADTTSLNGTYSAFNIFGKDANGMTAFYHVLDTHDLSTSTGPHETLLYGAGKYRYAIKNVISDTICEIPPDGVLKYFTVYTHNFSNDEDLGCGKDATVGNPCHVATGNKYQREVDSNGETLPIVRHYNSKLTDVDFGLGFGWLTPYHRRLLTYVTGTGATARHRRDDGYGEAFTRTGTTWAAESDSRSVLTEDGAGYTVTYLTRSRDRFDLSGRLLESTNESGQTVTLSYNAAGKLASVVDAYGHQLSFTYDANGRVASIDRGGSVYAYTYDATKGNLTRVTYPDGTTRDYLYELTSYRHNLTGILDENGIRWGTYTYDSNGRATASQHPGGAGNVSLTYTNSTSTSVTDALGVARSFSFSKIKGASRITSVGGTSCSWCKASKGATYDTNANVTSRTDFAGTKTCYAYDSVRNLELVRLEGVASGVSCPANLSTYTPAAGTRQRKITTQWHTTYPVPIQIDESGRRTSFTYDSRVNQLSKTDLDTATNESRTWTYTYDLDNRVLTADGPRTDVSDVTTYAYHACATGAQCGRLQTVTNALGHVTTYSTYNARGQPLTITDRNGVVTALAYDVRDRLISSTVGGEQTAFEYWPTGLLKKTTLPDGSYLLYTYDDAHRLTQITDSLGGRIVYTLDAMGNRTAEQVFDSSNTLTGIRTRVFDTANRLWKVVGAAGTASVTTTYGYDNNGNQTSIAAPLARNSSSTYDELNRLTQVTDPLAGVTQYAYNALDQLISVTDPRSKVTTYTYNALGDLIQLASPDTSTTSTTFDAAGNALTRTDARNKTATYAYDALNRITSISYPDQTLTYTYDGGSNQKGRLTQVTDASGSTSWTYDSKGRVLSRQQNMGVVKNVGYAHDAYGRLQTLTLPSGNTVTYGYTSGRVTSLSLNGSTTILSDVLYEPFNGLTRGWTWGNSTFAIREYNTDGLVTDIDSAGLRSYAYDDAFRITGITDAINSTLSQSYGYDLLDRLSSATDATLNQSWTYDANGNRLSQGGSHSSTYSISSTSNRLTSVSGALSRSYSYDAAGNTTSDGAVVYVYNDAGRMVSATKAGVTTAYAHNALGQRVKKTTAGATRYFVYDEAGHLLGEYDGSGDLIQETIWLGEIPVATLLPNGAGVSLYYIHTDHLSTPRRISRPSDNVIVWHWDADPFGAAAANEDPDGDSIGFQFQLRFAGQYSDSETGLHYNYFRDGYDSMTGSYTQSDPIGLGGGINTYAYVSGNPLSYVDAMGLCKKCGLKKAPEYDKQGTVARGTLFSWSATFKNDADHDPKCCEVRQFTQWNRSPSGDGRPPHAGFASPENEPHTWYEDRDATDWRYGHRTGSYADPTINNSYRGNSYYGDDRPNGPFIPGFHMQYQLRVLDVCNGGQTIHTSRTLTVDFGVWK